MMLKNSFALFLVAIYSCFISSTLWAAPKIDSFVYEHSLENPKDEKTGSESGKEIESPHFVRIHKNLSAKVKIARHHFTPLKAKKAFPCPVAANRSIYFPPGLSTYNLPLFLQQGVLRI